MEGDSLSVRLSVSDFLPECFRFLELQLQEFPTLCKLRHLGKGNF